MCEIKKKIEEVIKKDIEPGLAAHGGSIELVSVEAGVVKTRLKGACSGCPSAQMTMKMGVEKILKEKVEGIKEVIAV